MKIIQELTACSADNNNVAGRCFPLRNYFLDNKETGLEKFKHGKLGSH